MIKEEFQNPSAKYRCLPFWAWNDQLEVDEIKRQIISMKQQGIGGFFMHSRDGLETDYMSNKWKQCIRTAVETAKENDMYAWLYDEDRWPSGTAGGRVTKEGGDAFRCKGLTLEVCEVEDDAYKKDTNVLALYHAKISDMAIEKLQRIPLNDTVKLNSDEKLLVARLEVSGKSEWFNNEAPPDNLNPDAVKYFIELTHQTYKDIVGKEFGKTIPGIFTDEPSLADRHTAFHPKRGWIPWTYGFETFYKKRRGADVLDTLPYIYFNCGNSAKARHDYWYTIAERFSESYSKSIGQWCSENNISYTGHFLQEDKLGLCARVNGAIMPHYQYQQVPGIDMLSEQTIEYMTVKQCTSVAHQFNRPIVLSETYGCTGWEFTFEGQKWVGDWQYALGINQRCQHLALYSIRGCRKRDYPPSFNYNTSWWNKNHVVEDYFARLSVALRQGQPIRKILLLHPMSTVWSQLGTNPYGNPIRRNERDVPALNEYGDRFNQLIQYLCKMHLDCDLGDEMIMQHYGGVEGSKLRINCAVYDIVVIPQIDTMLRTTFELLTNYVRQGGKIIMLAPIPYAIDGQFSQQMNTLIQHPNCKVVQSKEDILLELEKLDVRTVSFMNKQRKQEQNLLYSLRKSDEGLWLFVVNNNRELSCEAEVELPYVGEVECWDPLTGQVQQVITQDNKSTIKFSEHWEKAESKLYFIKNTGIFYINEKIVDVQKLLTYKFPEICKFKATTFNAITLDVCRYKMDGQEFSEKLEVWNAQYQVRQKLGMRQIHVNGLEQRYKWTHLDHPNDGKGLELAFEFDIEKQTGGLEGIYLVLERANQFEITCNDTRISNVSEQWFLDRSFNKILLKGLVNGKNQIKLCCKYTNAMELENCYIIGDFGVTVDRKIVDQPETIKIGDWTLQGYFHYTGSLIYQYDYEYAFPEDKKLYLDIKDFKGVCACVKINDYTIDVPWAAAASIQISDYVKKGHNAIEIEVFSSPRNMLGPLHLAKGKRLVTNDECFCVTGEEYTQVYNVEPYGLMSVPQIYIEQ